jgi:uncharacterized protein involved in response to NO
MAPIPRLRPYSGPSLFSYGFRPFFLFGALYAGLAISIWLPLFYGSLALRTAFTPLDWHVHEMLYGYLPAVVTGFLLTAIPNWTGRLPLQGGRLVFLLAVWAAGRLVVLISAEIGWLTAAIIDSSFLFVVVAAAAREIMAGRNWANLKVLLPLSALGLGNLGFHIEAHFRGTADYSIRIGIAAVVVLIMLIGGRIIPSFTRNWLVRDNPGRLPIAFSRMDVISIALSATALLLWMIVPYGWATAIFLLLAAAIQTARLARWAGDRTLRERLVLILHVGYGFVPLGFALCALGAAGFVAQSAGVHAWMAGAAGLMTLAVMTRASLGHTGRELKASFSTQCIYAFAFIAAVARICAALDATWSQPLLDVAALAWTAAFLGFGIVYGPILVRAKKSQTV